MALPVTMVYLAGYALLMAAMGHAWWLQMGIVLLATVMMAELNNVNALIRVYSRMVSCSFLVMTAMASFMLATPDSPALQLTFIAFLLCVLHAYQDGRATGWVFYAFCAVGLGSLVCVQVLYFVPLLWVLLGTNVLALSLRTFLASVFGVATPYWFVAACCLFTGRLPWLWEHFGGLASPGEAFDLSVLSLPQAITFIFVALLAAIGSVHFLMYSYKDKIRTRMVYEMFITLEVCTLAAALVLPHLFNAMLALAITVTAPVIGHYMALSCSKVSNITFFVIVALSLALTFFNLWTL